MKPTSLFPFYRCNKLRPREQRDLGIGFRVGVAKWKGNFLAGTLALLTKGAKVSILQCRYSSDILLVLMLVVKRFLFPLVLIKNQSSDLSNFCSADRDSKIFRCFQNLARTRFSQCLCVSVWGVCVNPVFEGPGRDPLLSRPGASFDTLH